MSGRHTPPKGRGGDREIDLRHDLHGHVIDYVSGEDRAWFAAHPGEEYRHRPPYEHELCDPVVAADDGRCHMSGGPIPDGAQLMVEVRQLAPGARVRRAYWVLGGGM